jgi:hypothetical protein
VGDDDDGAVVLGASHADREEEALCSGVHGRERGGCGGRGGGGGSGGLGGGGRGGQRLHQGNL